MKDLGLPNGNRLKHRKDIEVLFNQGVFLNKHPVALIYTKLKSEGQDIKSPLYQVGFTVSKKLYKRAVDRNRIKRLLREGFRMNQQLIPVEQEYCYHLMLIYRGKRIISFDEIEQACKFLLKKLV